MSASDNHHLGEDLALVADGGGSLEPARRAELMAHVESCAACKGAVEETRRIFAVFAAESAIEPSPSFDEAMFARLDAVDAQRAPAPGPTLLERIRDFFTLPRMGLALGAAAAAFVAIVTLAPGDDLPPAELLAPDAVALVAGDADTLEVAENLELLQDYDLIENLDVIEDLDAIEALEEEPG